MSQTKAQLIDTLVASLLPASDSSVDIGSNAVRFANIYGDTLYGNGANLTGINTDLVSDTSPQLGGNLDVNTKNILFGDSASASDDRLIFGAGSDLSIYHNGSHSFITNATGFLSINTDNLTISDKENSDIFLRALHDGAVELYYDNEKVFYTRGDGVQVQNVNGDGVLYVVGSEGNEAIVKLHADDGDDNADKFQIVSHADNYFAIQNFASGSFENNLKAFGNGSVELYHDNSKKFETTSYGAKWTGNLLGADNQQLQLGSSGDLQLYHDGTNSYIDNANTGILRIRGGSGGSGRDIQIQAKNGEFSINAIPDGAVELYYDNTKTFETKYNGIIVLGGENNNAEIEFHADEGDDNADKWRLRADVNGQFEIENFASGSYENNIECNANGNVELYFDNTLRGATTSSGFRVHGVLSTNVTSGQAISLADNARADFGAGDDLQIYHDGTHSRIYNSTGNLSVRSAVFDVLNADGSERMLKATADSGCELFFNGDLKVQTRVGDTIFHDDIRIQDNNKINIGTGDDLQIYHDGNHSYIQDTGTGKLRLTTNSFRLLETDNSAPMITADENGAVTLNYDGSKKFETLSSGVTISGGGLNVQRSSDAYSGAIYFAGFGDTNHVVWQDHFDNPNGTRGTGNGFDGIKWNTYAGIYFYANGNEAEKMAVFLANSKCELYFDNSKKFSTQTWGVQIYGDLIPGGDNNHDLGASNERWSIVYAANGSIQTSDKNEKNTITESDLGLDFINKLNPISYKWNKDDGKTHYGLIAQDVEETLTSIGKTVSDFGGIHKEDNSPMGLGYSELIAPLIKAVQELSAEVAALKAA